MSEARTLYASRALLPDGWAENVAIGIDALGVIVSLEQNLPGLPSGAESLCGVLVPGMPNCHSHAFQRAMVGLTETRGSTEDSFWSWRDTMYRLLGSIGPDELGAISEQLYIEMLKLGYTSVAEFHYLHHNLDGTAFDDPAEMSHRVINAAQAAGIHITHLPVLYCHSDFGAKAPEVGQRRFVHEIDAYLELWSGLYDRYNKVTDVRLGMAPHSLRAVSQPLLREAIVGLDALDASAPIQIHIAEQQKEVESCLAHTGARPVEWLLREFEVNARWCLVHATHLSPQECRNLASSAAVAGLCPSTEANLGDGIFPAVEYLQAEGSFAIGSDSQVCLSPAQELRLLEYGQRLQHQKRVLLATEAQASVGESLYREALDGGARALGIQTGTIAIGARADLLVLDDQHPSLYGKSGAALLDSWIFACDSTPVRHVMVGGQWRVRDGVHPREEIVAEGFRRAIDKSFTGPG
jgi:formimidoylglutamate deiminase